MSTQNSRGPYRVSTCSVPTTHVVRTDFCSIYKTPVKFLVFCFFLPDENCDDLSQTFLTDCENLKYGLEAQNQNEYFVLNVLSGVHTKKQERCNFCTFNGAKNATLGAPFWVHYCIFSKRCNFAPVIGCNRPTAPFRVQY